MSGAPIPTPDAAGVAAGAAPEVATTDLAPDQIVALFRDYAAHTELTELRVRGGPTRSSQPDALDLDIARARLTSGSVSGLQIAYRYQGAHWIDTLLSTPHGARLVRARTIDAPVSGGS